jgi:hypothetical protein
MVVLALSETVLVLVLDRTRFSRAKMLAFQSCGKQEVGNTKRMSVRFLGGIRKNRWITHPG